MSVEIYIARHGQNQDNVNGILNGHRDLPLTELGRQQAMDLAEGILDSNLHFDAIYSSPLSRALETATIVANHIKGPAPIVYDQMIERDFGVMTGEKTERIEELCAPDIIKTDIITYFLSPQGAETFDQLLIRAQQVLQHIIAQHTSGKVLLVCHGDIGKMIYCAATGKPWREVLVDFHFGNGDLIDISDTSGVHVVKLKQYNH